MLWKIGGSLTDDTKLQKEKLDTLKAPIFFDRYFPKWVVAFGFKRETEIRLKFLLRGKYTYISDSPQTALYKERLNVFWLDLTRPELPRHNFSAEKNFNPETDAIYIFERRKKN